MSAEAFLAQLADPRRREIDCARTLLVVAHPDDETIALGGQMDRLRGIRVVVVTDGAPEGMTDAQSLGFATRKSYAEARRRELHAALALAGHGPEAVISLGVPDQQASMQLVDLSDRLAALLGGEPIELVITHAYEGGHPDHDATSFAVHAARGILSRYRLGPDLIEFPGYHSRGGAFVAQQFAPVPMASQREHAVALPPAARDLKARMLAAHQTQARTLGQFHCLEERFRPAPFYDFDELPNGGDLLYARFDWGTSAEQWQTRARAALAELYPER